MVTQVRRGTRRTRFLSSLEARGVGLALPEPIVERAAFRYENATIVPTEFFYEDGTRRGEHSFYTAFDWPKNRAITIARGRRADLELQPGVLDRATMHVALMRDLASGEAPRTYSQRTTTQSRRTAMRETDMRLSVRHRRDRRGTGGSARRAEVPAVIAEEAIRSGRGCKRRAQVPSEARPA